MRKLFPAAASIVLLAACGGGLSRQMENPEDPQASLVYGYIDMADGPCWLEWFNMKQVAPKVEKPFYHFRVDDGVFYAEYIPIGSFQLNEFGGWGTFPHGNTMYSFFFPKQLQGLRIEKPGIYYIGALKMKDEGNFFKSKYDIDVAEKPSEREVLEKLVPHAKGTTVEARLLQRLGELK
ncbi:MAG: hypothetical protein JO332_16135 [Planctomycetaceae bacterium]|nr:hypothetical protein [Planctomycetaceae bacterium]